MNAKPCLAPASHAENALAAQVACSSLQTGHGSDAYCVVSKQPRLRMRSNHRPPCTHLDGKLQQRVNEALRQEVRLQAHVAAAKEHNETIEVKGHDR
jgi:hypothetical protein